MVSAGISGQLERKRRGVIPVKCVALLVCFAMNVGVSMSEKYAGDTCTLASGQRGVCRDLDKCSTFYAHPSMEDTCGFRARTPIVCCLERLVSAEDSRRFGEDSQRFGEDSRRPNDNPRRRNDAPRKTQSQWARNDYEVEPSEARPSRQTETPWWFQGDRPFSTTERPSPWGQPVAEDVNEYERPTTRRPTTRRTTTRRPSTSAQWAFEDNTPRPRPKPTPSPPPQRPSLKPGAISEAKCTEYSRPVRREVQALPLLPVSEPVVLQVDKCNFNRLELIVGGTNTSVGEFPHMAALGYLTANGYEWNCGGSLISELFVMTAAHCTISKRGPLQLARLGELNLKSDFDGASPVNYRVGQIIRHPDYSYPAHYNDIALLRLTKRVEFNDNIRPACLYTRSGFDVSKTIATGWGQIGFTEDPSDIMLKVAIDIIDSGTCNRLYQSSAASAKLSQGIVPSMMCAGDLKGGKDACQGDSGGPIQISNSNNHCIHYVIGVTSFGKFCAEKNSPGVYTRVSSFIPWIESTVWPSG